MFSKIYLFLFLKKAVKVQKNVLQSRIQVSFFIIFPETATGGIP